MPLRLTPFEYILARLNILPTPLFDAPIASGLAKMLVTACELGIFDALSQRSLPLNVLAGRLQCEPNGLKLLLNLLISAGYLRERKGYYHNTHTAQRWLTTDSPTTLVPYILHSPDIAAIWDTMPEVIRTNQQAMHTPYADDASQLETRQRLTRHYAGLASLATALGSELIRRVRLSASATTLLDVGGSHAAYSALFCRKYPQLHATILDIEPGIEAGQRTAKQMKLEERMSFICADFVQDAFETTLAQQFDVALYFHIAHLLPTEINQAVLNKVAQTLKPGGILVYVDQVTEQKHNSRLASLTVQLMTLTTTTIGGTCYPFTTVKAWLENAGMTQVKQHHLLMPGTTMIKAIKKHSEANYANESSKVVFS